jgi:transcriptional regulator with XRE-family HTH domain
MIVGERVQERLDASGLSQAELARRIGVAQPTIHNLIHRAKKGSTHLHRVARELGTTPAYLTGETDDPTAETPDFDPMTSDETNLLANFRALDRDGRAAVIRVTMLMAAGMGASKPVTSASDQEAVKLPPEPALAEMFQGLLRAPQTKGKSGDALARGLAKLLPTGLRQVQGPLRIEQTDAGDEQAELPGDQQRNRPERRQASRK